MIYIRILQILWALNTFFDAQNMNSGSKLNKS